MYYILENKIPKQIYDVLVWAKWFETTDRRVADFTIGDFWISTVFLGIDHDWSGLKPLLFETMIFYRGEGKHELDLDCYRYCTWEEAELGHKKIVEEYIKKAGETNPTPLS